MALKSFGKKPTENRDYIAEIYEAVGANFPVKFYFDNSGMAIGVDYETEWKTGTTKLVQKEIPGKKKGEKILVDEYEPDYQDNKLTAKQVALLEAWLKKNIV